jgi:leucyl/phenylalanyl-tRNA--protein transferase
VTTPTESEPMEAVTPELLLAAYASGYFPMAVSRTAKELDWFYPEKRGILPLDTFHVPRSLAKLIRKIPFTITTDEAFREVMLGCTERKSTWINDEIISLYCELQRMGFAHSIECWQEGKLVGGLYGVALGRAFFGESMFSRTPNASRVALVYLVQLLNDKGYQLLDTQFINDHLKQFGVLEIPRAKYLEKLKKAVSEPPAESW